MDKEAPFQTDPYFSGPLSRNGTNKRNFRADGILLIVFFFLIVGSVAFTYYRIMLKKDYLISSQVDCDPYAEKCFIWNCDPDSTVEGEACVDDPEMDVWYYKIVERNASRIPLCNPEEDEDCQPFLCESAEPECAEILCTEETVAEGEACNDPEEYALNNPIEEEELECDPEADEECLVEETEEGELEVESEESEENEEEVEETGTETETEAKAEAEGE